ncbi:MAG TPA: 2-dehydropantoate 2-reductase [Stellaceae bacterium]|nr:2-dehydropantoate 2-reductase [Stellaceae bacterium]
MRFLVLGAGGLGGFFGASLLEGGAEVAFLVRARRAEQLARDGLVVKTPERVIRRRVKTLGAGACDGRYDVVLLACKAYDLDGAIADFAPALGDNGAVLPVLNGIAHIARLTERFGEARVLGGVSMINAHLSPDGEITRFAEFPGWISVGELDGRISTRCEEIARAFEQGGVPSMVSSRILAEMWEKFAAFAAIAEVATLTRASAGAVAATAEGAAFVAAACEECARVTAAEGYPPPREIGETIRGLYARAGSPYRPSILVDLEAGRPTEGEHTIGDLVRRAVRHGIAVPALRAALCALQAHEVKRRERAPG